MSNQEPFERDELVDKPGIVGARWWNETLKSKANADVRRRAVLIALGVGGALLGLGTCVSAIGASGGGSSSSEDDYRTERRSSLAMQKDYGWSFGAASESVTFNGESTEPFDRTALRTLADDLSPARSALLPYYTPTLFQSPEALPKSTPVEDTARVTPLRDVLKPIATTAMQAAYRRGKALASLFAGKNARVALIADLDGPLAVALAAGASEALDPVFLFDNWPHPRGVSQAHLPLAAAAYYQPRFKRTRGSRGSSAPPLFLIERSRLNTYSDDMSQFDNRYVAKLPSASAMKSLGVDHVLLVVPDKSATRESDDMNDDFVAYAAAGMDAAILSLDLFDFDPADVAQPPPPGVDKADHPPSYYGGTRATHLMFWVDYPWLKPPPPGTPQRSTVSNWLRSYTPAARSSSYSTGVPGGGKSKVKPADFGTIPVVVAVGTGLILGAKMFRNGSWNRVSGGWGG